MSDDREGRPPSAAEGRAGDAERETAEPSVLGSLPRHRPAVRSPRRKPPAERGAGSAATPGLADRTPGGGSGAPGSRSPGPRAGAQPSPSSGPLGDLEGLAREGAVAAAGVASLGLRIAGRAAAAVRDAVERR